MTKPIDWTKPLRVVGTHEPIESTTIDRHGRRSVVVEHSAPGGASYHVHRVDPATGRTIPPEPVFVVENVPREPRIVERWVEVVPYPNGAYRCDPREALEWRFTPSLPHRRLAKLLIEEPE